MTASRGRRMNPAGSDSPQDQGGQSPETPFDPWKHEHVQVMNTFITVSPPLSETASGFIAVRRQISDPTSSRSSSLSSSQSTSRDEKKSFSSAAREDGKAAKPSKNRTCDGSADASHSLGSKGSRGSAKGADQGKDAPGRKNQAEQPAPRESGEAAALHAKGQCKPCAFHSTPDGCAMGAECRFCHFPHKAGEKIRLRPCRGKRMRNKRMFDRLGKQAASDPDGFDFTSLQLPPSLDQNTVLKSRLISHLSDCANQARAGRSSASEEEEGDPPRCRGYGSG